MELYLFRPEEHERLYGCANITVENVPLEKRTHIFKSVALIVLCTIYYVLYIPCIPSIYRHMKNPCYILLFYISVVDCLMLWIAGFLTAYFALTGAVYCSHPKLIYIVGSCAMAMWACESSCQLILVIDRCLALLSANLEKIMFEGRRIYLWLAASIAWGIYWLFYMLPVLFTGIYFSWFFNPYVGYIEDLTSDYHTNVHVAWDGGFAIVIPLLYIVFSILFLVKSHKMKDSNKISKQEKMMLLQVFVVSMLNFNTTSSYIVTMYIVPSELFIHFGHFCWFHIHGLPPVIYLLFNPTIREDAKRMLGGLVNKLKRYEVKELTTTTNKVHNSTTNL